MCYKNMTVLKYIKYVNRKVALNVVNNLDKVDFKFIDT